MEIEEIEEMGIEIEIEEETETEIEAEDLHHLGNATDAVKQDIGKQND